MKIRFNTLEHNAEIGIKIRMKLKNSDNNRGK